jgi:hypothetical protein
MPERIIHIEGENVIYGMPNDRNTDPITGKFNKDVVNMDSVVGEVDPASGKLIAVNLLVITAMAACMRSDKISATQTATAKELSNAVATQVAKQSKEKQTQSMSRMEKLFNNPGTGLYSRETLELWSNIEPQPKLDPRLGITILPSKYVRGEGTIQWHTDVAARLGFQSVAIVMSPPEFTNHTGISIPAGTTLDQLAQREDYKYLFNKAGINNIHITTDVGNPEAANGWQFADENSFTHESLQKTYEEYYRLAEYLLVNFGDNGKEITIGGPNEVELLTKGGYRPDTEDKSISPKALEKAVAYYNTMIKAVRDANAAHTDKKSILTGLEVLQIRSEFNDPNTLTGLDIIKNLQVPPDTVTLSAWQFAGKGKGGYWLEQAAQLIKSVAPNSKVEVTEYGIAENVRQDLKPEQLAGLYAADIKGAIKGEAQKVFVWGLTDFNSQDGKIDPNNKETDGLGLIRPDGTMETSVYNQLRVLSRIKPIRSAGSKQ